jgi:hypothetical protein
MPAGSYGGKQAHPLADAFPLMDGDAYQELKERIGRNGLIHPITIYEGKILDGRNRKRACQELGIACAEKEYRGDDPAGFVWDENVARRQMNASQIAMAAQAMETLGWGSNQFRIRPVNGGEAPVEVSTRDEIARRTGASSTSMDRAKRVRSLGVPEVTKAVEAGELALTTADRLVRKPEEEQAQIMALPPKEIPKAVPEVRALSAVPDLFVEPVGPKVPSGPGRGGKGPKILMTRHMTLPDIKTIRGIYRDWTQNADLIPELDQKSLYDFVAELRKTKTDLVKLIHLIEKSVEKEPGE